MAVVAQARQQVAIAGRVTDELSGRPVEGARVELTAAPTGFSAWLALRALESGPGWDALPERPDRAGVGPDGHFHFLDLPDGKYTVTASHPQAGSRYGTVGASVTVPRSADGSIIRQAADLKLPPTAVTGKVTGPGSTPSAMAEVRLRGSAGSALTDAQGTFILAPVEAGKQTLLVSARGFPEQPPKAIQTNTGKSVTANVTLSP
jgi:hypothetical protein